MFLDIYGFSTVGVGISGAVESQTVRPMHHYNNNNLMRSHAHEEFFQHLNKIIADFATF